jgi:phage terminase small subunit
MTPRQRQFVQEYLIDFNASQAMQRAGFSRENTTTAGARMLRNPKIKAAIDAAMAARAERTRITADRVLKEYARIAFADIRQFMRWDGKTAQMRPETEIGDDQAAAIAELYFGAGRQASRLRLHDKKAALDALARHLGLFDPRRPAAAAELSTEAKEAREVLRQRVARFISSNGAGHE